MTISNPETLDFSDFATANTLEVLSGYGAPTWTSTPPTTRLDHAILWQPVDEFDYGVQFPNSSTYALFYQDIGTNHNSFFNLETKTSGGVSISEYWENYVTPYTFQGSASSNYLEFYNVRLLQANTPTTYLPGRTEDIPLQYFIAQIEYDSADQPFEFAYDIDANTIQFRTTAAHGDY